MKKILKVRISETSQSIQSNTASTSSSEFSFDTDILGAFSMEPSFGPPFIVFYLVSIEKVKKLMSLIGSEKGSLNNNLEPFDEFLLLKNYKVHVELLSIKVVIQKRDKNKITPEVATKMILALRMQIKKIQRNQYQLMAKT